MNELGIMKAAIYFKTDGVDLDDAVAAFYELCENVLEGLGIEIYFGVNCPVVLRDGNDETIECNCAYLDECER